MYTVVLLAAMTTGMETPDFGRRCHGCCGCSCCCSCYCCGCHCCGCSCCGCHCWCHGCCGCCCCGCHCCGGYAYGGGYGGGYALYGTGVVPTTALAQTNVAAPATVAIHLPADAKLMVDGQATRATSATRVFSSPNLVPGRVYTYQLSAERMVDGTPQTVQQTVEVRAGRLTDVTLSFPASGVASR